MRIHLQSRTEQLYCNRHEGDATRAITPGQREVNLRRGSGWTDLETELRLETEDCLVLEVFELWVVVVGFVHRNEEVDERKESLWYLRHLHVLHTASVEEDLVVTAATCHHSC